MGSGEHCSNPCRQAGSKDPGGVPQRPAKKVPGLSQGGNQMGAEAEFVEDRECRNGQSIRETWKGKESESHLCSGFGVFIEDCNRLMCFLQHPGTG